MQQENLMKNSLDLSYLISCALHDVSCDVSRIEKMDIAQIYELAKFHSLLSISFAPLERYLSDGGSITLEEDKLKNWRNMREFLIRKNLMFDFEREKLIEFFEKNGIRYLPLKGLILRKLYPKMGWRFFADNDILFDRNYRAAVHDFFVEQGYDVHVYENNVHDIYLKPPFFNFEMHVDLMDAEYEDVAVQKLADYYADSWRGALDDEKGTGCHLSDEDFYVYLIAHAYKHVRYGGTGLRTLVDVYVYLSRKEGTMNRDYIAAQLAQMEMTEFERELRRLSMHLLSSAEYVDDLDSAEKELFLLHASSGTFGTYERMIKLRVERSDGAGKATFGAKIRYCLKRIFPDMEYYKTYHPFFYKYKILIPAFVIWRLLRSIFIRDSARKELQVLRNSTTETTRW